MFITSHKRVKELEEKLQEAEKENKTLRENIKNLQDPEGHRSDYCFTCKFYTRLYNGLFFCTKFEKSPCGGFEPWQK